MLPQVIVRSQLDAPVEPLPLLRIVLHRRPNVAAGRLLIRAEVQIQKVRESPGATVKGPKYTEPRPDPRRRTASELLPPRRAPHTQGHRDLIK